MQSQGQLDTYDGLLYMKSQLRQSPKVSFNHVFPWQPTPDQLHNADPDFFRYYHRKKLVKMVAEVQSFSGISLKTICPSQNFCQPITASSMLTLQDIRSREYTRRLILKVHFTDGHRGGSWNGRIHDDFRQSGTSPIHRAVCMRIYLTVAKSSSKGCCDRRAGCATD